jgi:hypothetical protein
VDSKKYFTNTIVIEVLTKDVPLSSLSEDDIIDRVVYSDGTVSGPLSVTSKEIFATEVINKLVEFRLNPEAFPFFELNAKEK